MSDNAEQQRHVALTRRRARAFNALFGGKPALIYPFHTFDDGAEAALIDVFVYPLDIEEMSGRVVAAVTNGMSDHPMPDGTRCELVQYLRECDNDHAARLYDLAVLPHEDGFTLKPFETITLPDAVDPDTDLKIALFLPPVITPHREFSMKLDGDPMTLLWHVPITTAELKFKQAKGIDALVNRMEAVELPWVFDEADRPDLV
ncbi:MAG TPA: suppressor of fused domain protein [Acetobacteraceae bacterium]|nr:suppressor of fused domain protein [Acetobacteraceae bacterium]